MEECTVIRRQRERLDLLPHLCAHCVAGAAHLQVICLTSLGYFWGARIRLSNTKLTVLNARVSANVAPLCSAFIAVLIATSNFER